jgi:hypothetical protein
LKEDNNNYLSKYKDAAIKEIKDKPEYKKLQNNMNQYQGIS